jgi:dihydropteroate synthase
MMLPLGERPLVMGILNVTPDSFAERAPLTDAAEALDRALRMEAEGADLVDVGGESSRPGAAAVPLEEELARVLPVLQAVVPRVKVPISVDTTKAEVARAALDAGARLINDITGLRADPRIADVVRDAGAGMILMHMRGTPETMGSLARYENLLGEVAAELRAAVRAAVDRGVLEAQIIVDPGVGFAKLPSHSYGVLAGLPELSAAVGRPVLVGPSRKSFMREAVGGKTAQERDWGTAAAVTAAVLAGAHIVRVHAVEAMVQVVRVAEELRRARRVMSAES